LQKCNRAFFMRKPRSGSLERLSSTVPAQRLHLQNQGSLLHFSLARLPESRCLK
jgi:hypothetical protein